MTKEKFDINYSELTCRELWECVDAELRMAYNTIKTPTAFLEDKKTICIDTSDVKTSEDLFQFMLANFPSGYFKRFSKKICDYTEKGKIIPEQIIAEFDKFYALYPKKNQRHKTLLKYKALKPSTTLFNKIIEGLLKQKFLWERDGTEKQFMPNPDTWLNNRRWEDGDLDSVTLDDLNSSMERLFE